MPGPHLAQLFNAAQIDITRSVTFTKDSRNLLGEGSFGQVYLGRCTLSNNQQIRVAVKLLKFTPQDRRKIEERLKREVVTWKSVSQLDNVADFMGIYRTPNEPPYLVLPYYRHNNLLKYTSACHPDTRLALAKQICRGLHNLHLNNVVHGDLKPVSQSLPSESILLHLLTLSMNQENIMISDSGDAQIADFGVSIIPSLSGFTTVINWNARYSAPELLPITDSVPIKPTKETDIFSLGILLMQLFDGQPDCLPYNHFRVDQHRDPHEINLIRAIHQGDRPKFARYNFQYQENRWALIERCWAADPRSRLDIGRVRAKLA
ncbi:hypothetical protein HWV62_43104 [Athelia sp. TMB]|nr:hypothetical protein HWV62_43104 [Athelia sp. TMB]